MPPSSSPPESVWDYPRPPRLEPSTRHIRVLHRGVSIASTRRSLRILETSHPPVYYLPQADIAMNLLQPSTRCSSFCEFKGSATYWSLAPAPGEAHTVDVAWSYPRPSPAFAALKNHLAFYASRLDCFVDDEAARAQPGDFYGGWITSHIIGPFKGAPGTLHW